VSLITSLAKASMVNGALAPKNTSVSITSARESILQIQMIHNILIIGLNK